MYKYLIQTAAFIGTLTVATLAFSCGGGLKHMVNSLDLNDNQKAKIQPILKQLKTNIKNDASQMHDIDQQLDQQSESANMDQSKVESLVDKKSKLIGDIIKAKITAKNQIFAVLTTTQKTELHNKMQKMKQQMAKKYQKCHDDD